MMSQAAGNPDVGIFALLSRIIMRENINKLSPFQFECRYLEIPEGTVRTRLMRAKAELKKRWL
jgi:hypothetical protein